MTDPWTQDWESEVGAHTLTVERRTGEWTDWSTDPPTPRDGDYWTVVDENGDQRGVFGMAVEEHTKQAALDEARRFGSKWGWPTVEPGRTGDTMTDDLDLAAIEAREHAATPGPWEYFEEREPADPMAGETQGALYRWVRTVFGETTITDMYDHDNAASDAEFIAHARQDVPALVARVKKLEQMAMLANNVIEALAFHIEDEDGDSRLPEDEYEVVLERIEAWRNSRE